MFDHLLESSHRDDSKKWSIIEFGEETTQVEAIEVNFTHFIWSPGTYLVVVVHVVGEGFDGARSDVGTQGLQHVNLLL